MDESPFSLNQLQNWMQAMLVQHVPVLNGECGGDVPVGKVVNASTRLSAVKHLDIYRHSYIARLRSCMQNQFSALAYTLGPQLFESFADQYLDAYPSESYTLNTLGERFEDFLEQTRPDAGEEQKEMWPDFMIELAGFEYALSEIFDEKATRNDTVCAGHDIPDESLSLAPVFRLFHHRFPICKYYLEFTQDKNPELPFPEESFCAVTRSDYKLGLFTVRGAQYHFLKSMQHGRTIEEAKTQLVNNFHFERTDIDALWPEWRKNFIASGFFCV